VSALAVPAPDPQVKKPLVRVENLVKHFPVGTGFLGRQVVHAVDGVDLEIQPGETLGLVGESGCGKSTLGRVIVQLLPATSGHVYFKDVDMTKVRGEKLRRTRQQIQMIFQDPYASLNPRMTVGDIVGEPLRNFGVARGRKAEQRVQEMMRVVGLNPSYVNRYPHEFSGGQRQRIGIARALVLNPTFIVADEPVSALDVSIQAQIVNLMEDLQEKFNLTFLFIAHDLSVVRHMSDRIAVMYLGKIVVFGPSDGIRDRPLHEGAGKLGPGARPGPGSGAKTNPPQGRDPIPRQSALRLPFPHPLPHRAANLLRGRAATRDERERPLRGLPLRRPALGINSSPFMGRSGRRPGRGRSRLQCVTIRIWLQG
jgi:oligopeptide transport system ATP-binding protein